MDDHLARLARLDCCAVSDALDQLGLPASVTGLSCLTTPRRVWGLVSTVRLAAGPAPAGTPARHLATTAVEQAGPGSVIVVEQRTGIECAGWGGILSIAALARGVAGVIVDGLARDIDEADQAGFTVFARGATARTARGRVHEAATGTPISVGEVLVSPGDWVIADRSGVAFIPARQIDAVLTAAERIAAREAGMAAAARAGEPAGRVMDASYEQLLERTGD